MTFTQHFRNCECRAMICCDEADVEAGTVWRCPRCKKVTVCVRQKLGGTTWIAVSDRDVEFFGLLVKSGVD